MNTPERIKQIARNYTPDWVPDEHRPDFGTAFALAFSKIYDESLILCEKMLDKHYIAFLNSMGAEPPPPQCAEGFAVFGLAKGAPHGEVVPEGTVLYNDEIPYIVEESLYVSPAALTGAYCLRGDVINDALSSSGIVVFDPVASDLQRHEWIIAHGWAFNELGDGSVIRLDFGREVPCYLVWEYEGDAHKAFDRTDEGDLTPKLGGFISVGRSSFIRAAFEKKEDFGEVSINKTEISIRCDDVKTARFFHQDTEESGKLYPFGKTLTPNDCFYFACGEAFSKKGAYVTVAFNLTLEPGGDKPARITRYVLEYWNGAGFAALKGWEINNNPLLPEGANRALCFTCPSDMEVLTLNGTTSRWVRARILEVSALSGALTYEVPKIEITKVSYVCAGLRPSYITITNNMITETVSGDHGKLDVFKSLPYKTPSVFLGFGKPFGTQLINLLISPPDNAPELERLDFYTVSGGGDEFPVPVVDGTERLSSTGVATIYMRDQPRASEMFGKTLYWLRVGLAFKDTKAPPCMELGIYTNAARITQMTPQIKEVFSIDDNETEIRLKEKNITELKVYINGEITNAYRHNAGEGLLMLNYESLKAYVRPMELAVIYRATMGADGNCAENMVTRMADSLGYIQHVTNPFPVGGGWTYTDAGQTAGAKKLRHRQRAVAAGDFEALAYEFAGNLRRCRCLSERSADGRSGFLRLVYVPENYPRKYTENLRQAAQFSNRIKSYLLERCHPMIARGDRLAVCEASYKPVAVTARLVISPDKDDLKIREETMTALNKFLDPITGNFDGAGYGFGEAPDERAIKSFLYSLPGIDGLEGFAASFPEPDSTSVYVPDEHNISY